MQRQRSNFGKKGYTSAGENLRMKTVNRITNGFQKQRRKAVKITPVNDWSWNYNGEKLGIYLRADDGRFFTFNTHFVIRDLLNLPRPGEHFCCEDARLLTVYQEGLSDTLRLKEGEILDLGINAVACERFVRPSIPLSRLFTNIGNNYYFEAGSIVTVYTKEGYGGDCIVLEECDVDGLARLMLLNPELKLGNGRVVELGHMIRVNPAYLCSFRALSNSRCDMMRYA